MFNKLVAKEGYKSIGSFFILAIVFSIVKCEFLAFVFFALTLWFIFIYRNKKLKKDYDISDILSPISGKVSSIDKKDDKTYIYIAVSLFDNHILRAPKNGNFTITHQKGVHTLLDSLKARKLNEKATIKYSDMKIQLISSMFSSNLNFCSNEALMGDKIGIFLHGQVVIEIDNSKQLLVTLDKKVLAGKTVIARSK